LDNNTLDDVFVRDLSTGIAELASVNASGMGSGDAGSFLSAFSADGRVVVFESAAVNLHLLDNNRSQDIFARDLLTGRTHLVSINSTGNGSGDSVSSNAVISANGGVVAFTSRARNLSVLDTNREFDVYARDLALETTYLVSVNSTGTASGTSS
jgi:hypothetical protein